MLIPISKIISSNNRTESYNLYDVETGKVSNWKARAIKKALKEGYEIKGFIGCNLRLSYYFSNIGVAGVSIDDRQYYTVVKRRIYNNKTMFTMVDVVGKDYEFEKKDIIKFIQEGAVIAGVIFKTTLKVSSLIKTEFSK